MSPLVLSSSYLTLEPRDLDDAAEFLWKLVAGSHVVPRMNHQIDFEPILILAEKRFDSPGWAPRSTQESTD